MNLRPSGPKPDALAKLSYVPELRRRFAGAVCEAQSTATGDCRQWEPHIDLTFTAALPITLFRSSDSETTPGVRAADSVQSEMTASIRLCILIDDTLKRFAPEPREKK